MKIVIVSCNIALLCFAGSTLGNIPSSPISIVCIGDSITQGGVRHREEYTYRWPLFRKLVDSGVDFDLIGSKNDGLDADAQWPQNYRGIPFDADHEAVYGITTRHALERLPEAMNEWPASPNIALIHLGTNDLSSTNIQEDVIAPMRGIIDLLRKQNPRVVIFMGHLNFNHNRKVLLLRQAVENLRKELDTEQSPVRTVNHFEGWQENPYVKESDTFDGVHPNARGQEKMAEKWMEALRPFLNE